MFGGAYYIWFVLLFFASCGGLLLVITGILLFGHWMEKRRTGATHGFLELPHELRKPSSTEKPPEKR